jgi:hypothetical protein
MPQPNFDQEPAEGSRETIDHELARQDKKKQGKDQAKDPGTKSTLSEAKH